MRLETFQLKLISGLSSTPDLLRGPGMPHSANLSCEIASQHLSRSLCPLLDLYQRAKVSCSTHQSQVGDLIIQIIGLYKLRTYNHLSNISIYFLKKKMLNQFVHSILPFTCTRIYCINIA